MSLKSDHSGSRHHTDAVMSEPPNLPVDEPAPAPTHSVPAAAPQATAPATVLLTPAPPHDTQVHVSAPSSYVLPPAQCTTVQSMPELPGAFSRASPVAPAVSAGVNMPPEFLTEIMKVMQSMSERFLRQPEDKVKVTDVFLPGYDPDGNIGAREWCSHISTAKDIYKLSDYDVRMKVTSLLKGRAKLWADNWLVTTSTWEELRENIITTFEPETRYSRDVVKFREHYFDSSKDIAEFLSQSWILWRRVTKDKLDNSDAVEAVIGTVSDERLRIELMNARATSVPELISVASSIRKRPNPFRDINSHPSKRSRFTDNRPPPFCQKCKKSGHISDNCRTYNSNNVPAGARPSAPAPSTSIVRPNSNIKCSFCSKMGHTFETCFSRDKNLPRNVNAVKNKSQKVSLNTMRVQIGKVSLNTIFDSGAECSVMRESIAESLPGKRRKVVHYLRGIGPFPVISMETLLAVCSIDNATVEIEFHVLPDYEMTADALIGVDLLRDTGLSVIVTEKCAKLVHIPKVMHMRSQDPIFDNISHDLSNESDINDLMILLNKYSYVFTRGYGKTRVNTGELHIRLKNPDKYVERRPYRLSPVERENVRMIVHELLDNNIIQESESPFASPILLVKKKNGEYRLCVDYRELNSNTVRDHYPLPLIADQIDQLSGGKFFCTLDMASGFHQIPVASESVEKTAFITPDGLYEYLTMPFGLCNAPSVYQRCINRALGSLLNAGSTGNEWHDSVAQVYIDDVISKSRNFTDGLTNLERILIALRDSGFSVNIEKCLFFKRSIEYLGNVVEDGQVRPSPKKVEALVKAPIPSNAKQVRQFNGLAGYFRRFIPDFARIMIPLYELTKQGAKWQWTHEHEKARQQIIHHLTSAPVLTIFREGEPIELFTDASSQGLGAILVQTINGRQHVIAYFSMRTTDTESRYHSYELETLAVVRAIKHFRHFLYGRKFKVITDCNALKASKHKQDLLPRIHRWWAFLQNFEFDIEYRKGERMQHADYLSRNPGTLSVNVMTRNLEWLNTEQRRDGKLRPIIDELHNGNTVDDYFLEGDVLKIRKHDPIIGSKGLIVVPKSFQWSLINTYHTALKHPGWEKTLQKVRESYYFDGMTVVIKDFVNNCVVCRTSKGTSGATQVQLHPITKPSAAFEVIHMDVTGKLGTPNDQEYVIVTIDAFSKYVLLYYSNDKSQVSTLAALKRAVYLFGAPRQVIVDGGREFLGEYKTYCERFGIDIHCIAPGSSRANGQVERVMATLKNALIMIKNYETEDWYTALDSLQLALNCTTHRVTGTAPLTLLTRRQQCVPPELLNLVNHDVGTIDIDALSQYVQGKMAEQSSQDKRRFDKGRAKVQHFQRGDYVLIKNNPRNQTSLDLKFSEPFEVCRILENDRYLVKKVVGHRGRPRKVAHDQLRRAPQPGGHMTVSPDEQQPGPSAAASVDDGQQPGPSTASPSPAEPAHPGSTATTVASDTPSDDS